MQFLSVPKPRFLKALLLICLISLSSIKVDALSARGKGEVKGSIKTKETQQDIEFATIAVFQLPDSAFITGTVSATDGSFSIKDLPFDKYFLRIQFLGFKTKTISAIELSKEQSIHDLGTVELETAMEQLEGIEIQERRNQVEFKLDKQVVTVGEDNAVAGGTAIDILGSSPSIQTDINGDATLRGSSNFTVLIDGKPSVLSGNEALRQIPASSIDYIEIITNPSAKYDAEGTTGIVNVVLKKGQERNGSSGFVELSAARYHAYQTNLMFSHQRNKLSWAAGLSYQNIPALSFNTMTRTSSASDTLWHQESQMDREWFRSGVVAKLGLDYQLNKTSSLSASFQSGSRKVQTSTSSTNREYTVPVFQDDEYTRNYANQNVGSYTNASIVFNKDLQRQGKLSVDVQYYLWSGDHLVGFDELLSGTSQFDMIESKESSERHSVRLSTDYSAPLGKELTLETGLRSLLQSSGSTYDFWEYESSSETIILNPTLSQHFGFSQWVNAAYGTLSGKLKKLNYKLGLRAESTDRNVKQQEGSDTYNLNNLNLFPSIHISRAFGAVQTKASFSRRVYRPQEWDLYPYLTYIDPYNLRIGNPTLNPDYTNSYEIGFTKVWKKVFASAELYHRSTDAAVNRIRELQPDNTVLETPFNIASERATGLETMWNLRPADWFNMNLSARLYDFRFSGNLQDGSSVETQTYTWNTSATLNFYLPLDFHFQSRGFYYAPSIRPQGTSGSFGSVTMRLNKSFFEKSLATSFEVRDVFRTMRHAFTYSDASFELDNQFRFNPQIYKFTISYRFNKFDSSKVRRQLDKSRIDLEPSSFE